MNKIRVGGTFDFPYADSCFVNYPDYCKNPGTDIEYIYTVLNGMLHLEVEWVNFDTYYDVEQGFDSGDIDAMGLTYAREKHRWNYLYTSNAFTL